MDAGFTTPLLEFFKRGEVERDVRLLAARGALAPRAHEQLALLVLLLDDSDPEVARAADATLTAIPRDALSRFLAGGSATTELRAFFAARGLHPSADPSDEAPGGLFDEDEEESDGEESASSRPSASRHGRGAASDRRLPRALPKQHARSTM
jgi:hypothetical protein